MAESSRKLQWIVWGGLFAIALAITMAFVASKKKPKLPVLHKVPEFALTNQFGKKLTLSDLRGDIWLADIIFTRCAGPCPRITRQFADIQSKLSANQPVKLVTLTADPAFDSAEVLKKYGERFGADNQRWVFLTGPKKDIYQLAMDGLMLAVQEKSPQEQTSIDDLFIHSTIFVLVDKAGSVRAFYESDEPGTQDKILGDIAKLLHE